VTKFIASIGTNSVTPKAAIKLELLFNQKRTLKHKTILKTRKKNAQAFAIEEKRFITMASAIMNPDYIGKLFTF
jgi:hypothetical protein